MKASDLGAPQIGLIVYLPETEDDHATLGRLDAIIVGPSPKITLYLGAVACEVLAEQDIDLITPKEHS